MKILGNRIALTVAAVSTLIGGVVLGAANAFAQTTDPTASSVLGPAANTMKGDLLSLAQTVAPYAAALLAIVVGWKFVRKVVHF